MELSTITGPCPEVITLLTAKISFRMIGTSSMTVEFPKFPPKMLSAKAHTSYFTGKGVEVIISKFYL